RIEVDGLIDRAVLLLETQVVYVERHGELLLLNISAAELDHEIADLRAIALAGERELDIIALAHPAELIDLIVVAGDQGSEFGAGHIEIVPSRRQVALHAIDITCAPQKIGLWRRPLCLKTRAFIRGGSGCGQTGRNSLFIGTAVRSCLIVNPVLFRVTHSMTAGNLACRSGLVDGTRTGSIAEGLGSVAALARIPLINNHLDRHVASPYA